MPHNQAYLEAEKKIKEAQRANVSSLDLSGSFNEIAPKLSELPDSLWKLTQLRSLSLSRNQLTSLPESLNELTQLRDLNLANNQLTILPEIFGRLKSLQLLNVSSNQLAILPETLAQLTQLRTLDLSNNQLASLPESLERLTQLNRLNLSNNKLSTLPEWLGRLTDLHFNGNPLNELPNSIAKLFQYLSLSNQNLTTLPTWIFSLKYLEFLDLSHNQLETLPESLSQLAKLQSLNLSYNQLVSLPDSLGELDQLRTLSLYCNKLLDLPATLSDLRNLTHIHLMPPSENLMVGNTSGKHLEESYPNNPLNPELTEAFKQGVEAVKAYLRAKAEGGQIILNEAKLILIGEGEVGKTCLLDALLNKEWEEHPSTHGIKIQQIKVNGSQTQTEITLNGWDFGGQRVYRPTHQLFFSAPAVYLVVWKPREGPQQGFVKEWIQLIKRREPSAKILVVATHGGPQQRQPDIDRQELWDLFGKDTVVDFFFVDSKPDVQGHRKGIAELKEAIARVAAALPEVGRSVPKSFADVRAALQTTGAPYLPLDEVLATCRVHHMDDEIARLFITISHRLGHLTHYENDPTLRDIVILRPDWLATALSYVLDDEATRQAHGLVDFSRLSHLWDDPTRPADTRYPATLHRIFLRLMERFDLSYRVAGLSRDEDSNPVSLIAQLVPDTTPQEEDFAKAWTPEITSGDIQQIQICRIVDAANGQSANAEGLFFQLIVRFHRYSLGRAHYDESVHWQRGLILDADYNGRALLRHIGNDVHITVRAAYPQGFLNTLTEEVKYLVESFWEGLRCDVTVPCLAASGCKGLFEVNKLIDNKKRGRPEMPCPICNEWQNIDKLLVNAPAAQPVPIGEILATRPVIAQLNELRQIVIEQKTEIIGRFDSLDVGQRELLSKAETSYNNLIKVFTDEAKDGPRLFSLTPVNRSTFNPNEWKSAKFHLILWCEHSRWPLPILNGKGSQKGIYELELTREWFRKVSPVLKMITSVLSLVLPVAASGVKLAMDDATYKPLENYIGFANDVIDEVLSGAEKTEIFANAGDSGDLLRGSAIRAQNATLRELHALLKAKDPSFGGLVRVLNKRNEFLWVHEKFAGEY